MCIIYNYINIHTNLHIYTFAELAERLPLGPEQILVCFNVLLRSCGDYKTDKRGDTGMMIMLISIVVAEHVVVVVIVLISMMPTYFILMFTRQPNEGIQV